MGHLCDVFIWATIKQVFITNQYVVKRQVLRLFINTRHKVYTSNMSDITSFLGKLIIMKWT